MNYAASLLTLSLLLGSVLFSSGCTCGFDCSSDDDDDTVGTALFTLGLSDAPLEELKEVTLEIEGITLGRSATNGGDVEIETFMLDPNSPAQESVTLNLLDYPGAASFTILDEMEVEAGDYNGITLQISDSGSSSVLRNDDMQFPLVVSNGELRLSGARLTTQNEEHVIEFDLARSLYFEANNEQYRLTDEGVRVVDATTSAQISGSVDEDLFDTETDCADKDDETVGNLVYVYQGRGLDAENLVDVHDGSGTAAPSGAVQPFAVSPVRFSGDEGVWKYVLAYLPEGDYTIAFSCNAEEDDPSDYDGLQIPLPVDQVYEFTLTEDERVTCNMEESVSCVSN